MKNKEILYGIIGFVIGVIVTFTVTNGSTQNGMMNNNAMTGSNNVSTTPQQVEKIKQEEIEGQKLLLSIQSNTKACKDLSQDNFEKIGDYIMKQQVGSSEKHVVMDANMEQMMGKDNNVQMHILLGKNAAGCASFSDATITGTTMPMMSH